MNLNEDLSATVLTSQKARLFVDMDGTLTRFIDHTNDPETILQPGYFSGLPPQPNVVTAVKELIGTMDVYVLSAALDTKTAISEKNEWLDRYLPEIAADHRIFPPHGTDKAAAISDFRVNDVLLDDYSRNLHAWPGIGIKLMNGINGTHGTWQYSESKREGAMVSSLSAPSCLVRQIITLSDEKHRAKTAAMELTERQRYYGSFIFNVQPDKQAKSLTDIVREKKARTRAQSHSRGTEMEFGD